MGAGSRPFHPNGLRLQRKTKTQKLDIQTEKMYMHKTFEMFRFGKQTYKYKNKTGSFIFLLQFTRSLEPYEKYIFPTVRKASPFLFRVFQKYPEKRSEKERPWEKIYFPNRDVNLALFCIKEGENLWQLVRTETAYRLRWIIIQIAEERYHIYSIKRPGRLFKFGPMRVGAHYLPNIFSKRGHC